MAEMNARLRGFLNEVREWFWKHHYEGEDQPNDLLIAVGRVLRAHPELRPVDLLRDIVEADLGEFLSLDRDDPDVRGILEHHELKPILDDLLDVVVREILRAEDRPEGWESLPLDQRDGPTAKEDKRRLFLRQAEEEHRYGR